MDFLENFKRASDAVGKALDYIAPHDTKVGQQIAKMRKVRDVWGDAIGTSDFALDRRNVKEFAGVQITRENYDQYREHGTIEEMFGYIRNANPRQMYYGFGPSFGYDEAKQLSEYMRATDILSYLREFDVIIDYDDPKNRDGLKMLSDGIQAYGLRFESPPNLMEPYCDHPTLSQIIEDIAEEHRYDKYNDGPVYPFKTATKDELDEMGEHGLGY